MPLKSILSFLYSYWMLLSMKLLNISQLPVPRHSSMTKCWARKGEWGNHERLPDCGHEGKKHALHFPFSLSSPLTSKKRIVPWDGSCFSKMKEQKKKIGDWLFDIYGISMLAWINYLGFHMKENKVPFDQATIIFALHYWAETIVRLLCSLTLFIYLVPQIYSFHLFFYSFFKKHNLLNYKY